MLLLEGQLMKLYACCKPFSMWMSMEKSALQIGSRERQQLSLIKKGKMNSLSISTMNCEPIRISYYPTQNIIFLYFISPFHMADLLAKKVCVIDNGIKFLTIHFAGTGFTKMGWAGNTDP
jgi:hypothetical protein